MKIDWLGHDAIRIIKDDLIIYFDPYKIGSTIPADIIFISHEHFDHCSIEDIKKIQKDDTVIISSTGCDIQGNIEKMKPGESIKIMGVEIETVPSYNTNKPNHPKEMLGLGFIITLDGKRIYHAGDTDLIPEMSDFKCDIAFLPVSGTYVMNADEAAEAAKRINPDTAIPVHWGSGVVGTIEDAERFQSLLKDTDINVEIKEITTE